MHVKDGLTKFCNRAFVGLPYVSANLQVNTNSVDWICDSVIRQDHAILLGYAALTHDSYMLILSFASYSAPIYKIYFHIIVIAIVVACIGLQNSTTKYHAYFINKSPAATSVYANTGSPASFGIA